MSHLKLLIKKKKRMAELFDLLDCATANNIETLQSLLTRTDIDINMKDSNLFGWTPLILSCIYGHTKIVELLLNDERIEENVVDHFGQTAFFLACLNGKVEVVKLMLRNEKVNVGKARSDGLIPLAAACVHGHLEIVEWILVSGRTVNQNEKDKRGRDAIDWAIERDRPQIVTLLGSFGMDPEKTRFNLRKQLGISGFILFY